MTIILKNNVVGFLAVAVSAGDTVLRMRTNDGLKFPYLEANEYFYATISSATQADVMEIVKVTFRMNDNLSVIRAQEDTTAIAFPVGAKIELRVTAKSIKDAIGEVDVTSNVEAAQAAAAAAATSASNASVSADAAGASAAAALTSATNAETSFQSASASAGQANTYANQASASASNAAGSASSASISSGTAASSAFNAAGSATNAANSANAANTSASNAGTSATQASQSASDASGSAAAAQLSSTTAASSAFNAAGSANAASSSAASASTSATQSSTSASNAAGSASSASTSATNAANSATSAGNSATAASTSASNAQTSADSAGNSASSASTSATNAANSATNAGNSASAASTSASNASTSATNAGNSATSAQNSATSASTSASNAATSAGQASTSASNASTSASQASTSASNAAGSASSASTSATNAANSATSAGNSASAASTSASNASTSATNAGVSASAAQTSATNAAGSASNAASSASTASTQASNASASAASAAASSTLSANYAKQGGVAYTVSDFVADGLFWTTAFGGSPTTVADPVAAVTYTNVASVGRVARIDLSAGNIYLQPKAVFQPVIGRKYRARVTAKVVTDATGGGTISTGFYINGLDASFNHGDPSSDWTATADGARPSSDANFTVSDGVVNFGVIYTCTAVSTYSAYWRLRIGFGRTGGAGGVIEVREFLIEEITDIETTNATITSNQAAQATINSAQATTNANLSATVTGLGAAAGQAINSSANFSDNTNPTGVPTGWNEWTNGAANTTRVTGIAPQPYAVTIAAPAATECGILQPLGGRLTTGWHVLEADVTLNSGALTGAGMIVNSDPPAGYSEYRLIFSTDADINGSVIGAGTTGRLYKFRKLVQITAGNTYTQIFAMPHYSGLGSIAAANSITWHRCAVRPASQAEIEARQAKLDLVTANAAISANQTAIANETSARAAADNVLTARVDGADANGSLLQNPFFRIPFTSGTVPSGWYAWAATPPTIQQVAAPYGMAGNVLYMTANAGSQNGIMQEILGGISPGSKYKVGAQVSRGYGSFATAGIYIAWFTDAGVYIDATNIPFSSTPRTDGGTGATPDRVVRYEKELTAPANAYRSLILLMNGWDGFGAVQAAGIYWYEAMFAPATIAEAAIRTEADARATADSANTSLITSLTAKVNVNSNRFPHPQPLSTTLPTTYGWVTTGISLTIGTWEPLGGYFYYTVRSTGGSVATDYYYYDLEPSNSAYIDTGQQYTLSAVGSAGAGVAGDRLMMRIELLNGAGTIVHASPYVLLNNYNTRVSTSTSYVSGGEYVRRRVVFMRDWPSSGSYQDTIFNYIKFERGTTATAYTAEGSNNSLQASVTTNSSAIATVDGKLSASYGLTVDANGRIASMKLLSNGSTSEVAFRSDTFKVYNGASNDAVFEVSGGSVYIAALKVRTESMIANAVSQAFGSETDADYTVTTTYADIATVSVTVPTGAQVDVMWSFSLEGVATGAASDGGDAYIRLLRDGTEIYSETRVAHVDPYEGVAEYYDQGVLTLTDFYQVKQSVTHPSGMDFDSPGAGTFTYKLQIKKNTGLWVASKRRINAVLRKK